MKTVYLHILKSMLVKFQVGDFNPETDKVGVRGAPEFFDNPADWSSSHFI